VRTLRESARPRCRRDTLLSQRTAIIETMAVSHVFRCDRCPKEAGRVTLYAPGETVTGRDYGLTDQVVTMGANTSAGRPRLEILTPLGNVTVFEFDADSVLAAVGAGDAQPLYEIDLEYAPFWCPKCDASYCARHWVTWSLFDDGFFDETRGRCPAGHERRLVD